MIGVVGCGIVGTKVVESLVNGQTTPIVVEHPDQVVINRLIGRVGGPAGLISSTPRTDLTAAKVVVLACSPPHAAIARELLEQGVSVVSTSDDVADCINLLALDPLAQLNLSVLVVGAASSPGLSGLLVRDMARNFDSVDEVHIAMHGTGGPACARQHHRALAGQSVGWHDGNWLKRPGGSGRVLCWFPEPVGAYDCYRGALPDPLLIRRAFPHLTRVTARVSATRRDRVFAKLPMLIPPKAEGGLGALRVELRGTTNEARVVDVVGVVDRVGQIAGATAAHCAQLINSGEVNRHGVAVLGQDGFPNDVLLRRIVASDINIHSFVRA